MRIITGKARGAALRTLEGNDTRPTSERAKEAIFSMLQFEIEGRAVLDLFGGSGQLGLEALSRGASRAVIADASAAAVEIIERNAKTTKLEENCRIVRGDCFDVLRRLSGEKFDIVFLDPPYASGLIPGVMAKLLPLLKPTSKIIVESGAETPEIDGYKIKKRAKYGIAHVAVFEPDEMA